MARVEVTERELVAHIGPSQLPLERDGQTFLFKKTKLASCDNGGGIHQRDKANPQRRFRMS